MRQNPLSIYIHWPFCLSLCPYCDFNSHVNSEIDHLLWLNAYKKEILFYQHKIKDRYIKSIFFGGGTPSLMDPKTIEGIIELISSIAIVDEETEITIEANPTSYEAAKFHDFKAAGINRVSIGVQSILDERLAFLGRKHSAKEAIKAIESAASLFDRFSFDLIYATPNQTLSSWNSELQEALKFAAGHLSLYQLTIEKGTPFYSLYRKGQLIPILDDIAGNMYELTDDILSEHGYGAYEISNYARANHECKHNLCYWRYDEYLGIGPGAHGRIHEANGKITAVMMIHNPKKWQEHVFDHGQGIQKENMLNKREIIEEILMMGLRLKQGLSIKKFKDLTGQAIQNILDQDFFALIRKQGLIELENEYLRLTGQGFLLHGYLVPRLIRDTTLKHH